MSESTKEIDIDENGSGSRQERLVKRVARAMYVGAMERAGYSEVHISNGWEEKPEMRIGWELQAADVIREINGGA